jgi:hypothetical protein
MPVAASSANVLGRKSWMLLPMKTRPPRASTAGSDQVWSAVLKRQRTAMVSRSMA